MFISVQMRVINSSLSVEQNTKDNLLAKDKLHSKISMTCWVCHEKNKKLFIFTDQCLYNPFKIIYLPLGGYF